MAKLFANSGDPDQMPHFAASDLGLHCLPITLLWVSRLQWVKGSKNVPFRVDPYSEGGQNSFGRVTSAESEPIPIKFGKRHG